MKNNEAGEGLMEVALLTPLLCLLLLGAVELGRAVFLSYAVTHAATAGVQYGAQNPITAADAVSTLRSVTFDIHNIRGMTSVATSGCLCATAGSSCTGTWTRDCSKLICGPNEEIVQCVKVTTHLDSEPLFHWPGLPTTYPSNGVSIMRVRK